MVRPLGQSALLAMFDTMQEVRHRMLAIRAHLDERVCPPAYVVWCASVWSDALHGPTVCVCVCVCTTSKLVKMNGHARQAQIGGQAVGSGANRCPMLYVVPCVA